jgi:outer membrane biosynthesis protein TonB
MKKFITLASAGLLLFSLQGARAQKEVEPPAVPPMLEGSRPLAQPETREPAAPKQTDAGKAKPKAKAKTKAKVGKKTQKKAAAKKEDAKKPAKVAKKKSQKNQKKKPPEAAPKPETAPKQQVDPEEG